MGEAGGLDQRLGGDAAGPCAIAADAVALDQRHAHAQPGGEIRRNKAAGAGADDHEVEQILGQVFGNAVQVLTSPAT